MISELIKLESERQSEVINLIASENYISKNVKEALASDLSNKYAEGYPGARYYGGLNVIDSLENEVINIAKKLFNTDYHVNVQAYSGSIANLAVYFSCLKHGDTIMGMELKDGGHLTHGHPASVSSKLFNRIAYGVNKETETIDYEELERLAVENRPKLIISGASSYSRLIDFERISKIAKSVDALHLADISHISGLVATELHPTPFGNADFVMTTTHKMLRGPRGALLFCKQEHANTLDKTVFPGLQGGPHMNNIAAIGVSLEEALQPSYKKYCQQVIDNASFLANELTKFGLKIVSGKTENHLMMVDLRPLGILGEQAQQDLEKKKIIVNKNAIPFDTNPPTNPSGIRLGTCAETTKGITKEKLSEIARIIADTLRS